MKNKTTAGLLALFLGGVGAHKFYMGQIGVGVLYLVFCWTFVPAIIGFFEGISILTHNDDRWNAKYNNGMSADGKDHYDELLKLAQLKEKGLMDEKEYEQKVQEIKRKILDNKIMIAKIQGLAVPYIIDGQQVRILKEDLESLDKIQQEKTGGKLSEKVFNKEKEAILEKYVN